MLKNHQQYGKSAHELQHVMLFGGIQTAAAICV